MKRFPFLIVVSALFMSLSACQSTPESEQSSVIKVISVTLNATEKTLNGGETFQLVSTIHPENAPNKGVKYLSSKPSVASVDSDGLITALSAGTTNISVITIDGSHFAICKVTVISGGVTPITPDPVTPDPVTPDPIVPDPEPEPEPVDPHVDDEDVHEVTIQDNTVLHCWNWSMNTIKNNLNDIANAGFKTIQLSPMQPQKDYSGGRWEDQWWKLYQPLGFSIAQNNQNILGTKEELQSMCTAAEEKGINVIVDVVANHLAGGSDKSFDWNVQYFEPDIYNQNLIHQLGNMTEAAGYNGNSEYILKGAIGGFPDLQTESPVVQNRVQSLLKEYIDVGVDGFRFDAAKHIETPDDGDLASNFWPTVLNGATAYAHSKNLPTPYYYGEILTTPGTRRDFDWYTKYMSVTDNEEGTKVIEAIEKGSPAPLSYSGYRTALDADKLMLWGESHDTFANTWGSTKDSKPEDVNKAYCLQASRKDASTLYFARQTNNNNMGNIGSYDFKSSEIKAANIFHNKLMFSRETIHVTSGCYVNERGTKGVAIIGVGNTSNQVTIELQNIESGTYINLANNQVISIANNKLTLNLYNGVAFLIRNDL